MTTFNLVSEGIEDLYAFHFYSELVTKEEKLSAKRYWEIYDPVAEFQRMGVGNRSQAWRFSDINHDYEVSLSVLPILLGVAVVELNLMGETQFCPTYPGKIVVPSKISDTTLGYAVKYRSKGRLPGLVYLHWSNLVRFVLTSRGYHSRRMTC